MDAFCRDLAPYRVSWYAAMHRQLNPSIAEMEARAGKYLGLVAVAAKAGITVGQQGIRLLLDAGLLDVGRLLDASGPALLFPQKSVALTQLKLIGRVITVAPAAHSRAVGVAALAFGHERQDIQEAALALIRKHGIPDGAPVAEMRAHAADLAPSLAAQAAALGLGPEPCPARPQVSPASVQAPAPSCTTEGIAAQLAGLQDRIAGLPAPLAPDLAEAVVIVADGGVPGPTQVKPAAGTALPAPVTDPDELVQLLTVLLEDARDAMAVERALAGAVRLSSLPLRQRRQAAAPLLKRAAAVMDTYVPFSGIRITSDMALITHVWGGGELPTEDTPRHKRWHMPGEYAVDSMGRALTMAGIFSARAWEAARIIEAGQGGFLLAEPQTRRGAARSP